jgi:putative membrane protein
MFLVLAAGITMLVLVPGWLQQPWMHIKLCFVAGLIVYHFICQNKMKQMANGVFKWKSTQLRMWNEVSTIFLFAIVFLAVLKDTLNMIYATLGLIALFVLLMMAVKIYKRARQKKGQ